MSEGGAARAGSSPRTGACRVELRSAGGAATGSCKPGMERCGARRAVSFGGAWTEVWRVGARRVISAAGESGAGGIERRGVTALSDHATMFGRARSLFSLTWGGVTTVCERLSASRGSEMMGWRENSGSAFRGAASKAGRVSSGGRYSEAR